MLLWLGMSYIFIQPRQNFSIIAKVEASSLIGPVYFCSVKYFGRIKYSVVIILVKYLPWKSNFEVINYAQLGITQIEFMFEI